jgi:hypothetical protein
VCDRFEQAEQGLQLLLFAIINTFIFEAMKTDLAFGFLARHSQRTLKLCVDK